ncbi:hypothetical protein [Nonomuraea sp. KM90]|uniref:hypothetical protein n=1 Tax=Nonomuraea sp. KM90 TaxID=3457428 RepID=UPI003FCD6943
MEADRSAGVVLTLGCDVTRDALTSALLCLTWGKVFAGRPEEASEPLGMAQRCVRTRSARSCCPRSPSWSPTGFGG